MDTGNLYIVATPIGNLADITYRAVRILSEVALVAAEDTRVTGRLLNEYGIETRMISYHDHNKEGKTPQLIERLLAGDDIAIVSDAGTPGISDPAFYLVREAIRNNIKCVPIPGPSAGISALVASGLPTDRWVFEGFLPKKKGRHTRLLEMAKESRTIVLYESKYRLVKTLEDIQEYWGDRQVVVGREITKKFEEFARGTCSEMTAHFNENSPRGEFVIIVEGNRE
ncbi:MAG: 16S rRNA (cytidine(1402)-2'-O)-methyltransferase [Candidatus Marinimicrobia bacterium]|nr:16S rRNA (cytidine(1402)-2'-O)-methyltransferase [Candidatus Neomarinimicrobiota bacterium]MCF7828265.1 16S rRNA (cytidine(1402)-2'-O)-methyltransferase [Candidatus Neomarinimicrobiota bacterium]MCF7879560.1 16S rRNA (cytidine(1402)-2'-O)-methyltransferase [Candidatus Neomarinimicrobiota bacterium]